MFNKLKASVAGLAAAASLALVPLKATAAEVIIIICDATACLIIVIR